MKLIILESQTKYYNVNIIVILGAIQLDLLKIKLTHFCYKLQSLTVILTILHRITAASHLSLSIFSKLFYLDNYLFFILF